MADHSSLLQRADGPKLDYLVWANNLNCMGLRCELAAGCSSTGFLIIHTRQYTADYA